MTTDDRFSNLSPTETTTTVASLRRRFGEPFNQLREADVESANVVSTGGVPLLDEVATTAAYLGTVNAALQLAKQGNFPKVPAAVIGVEQPPSVVAGPTAGVDETLNRLGTEAGGLFETLSNIPHTDWGRTAHMADRPGHATIDEMAKQAIRYAVGAIRRINDAADAVLP